MTARFSVPIAVVVAAIGTTFILTSLESSANLPSMGLLILTTLLIISALIVVQPLLAAIGILAFAFINPTLVPSMIEVGDFSLRYPDLLFSLMAFIICIRVHRSHHRPTEIVQVIVPVLPFLVYTGLSLSTVNAVVPDLIVYCTASYVRLVITALLAPLFYAVVRTSRDIRVVNKSLAILVSIVVATGIWEWFTNTSILEGNVFNRVGGIIGINSLGLVSGLLVLLGFVNRRVERRIIGSFVPITVGLSGLILAKSASSIVATILTITINWAAVGTHPSRVRQVVRWMVLAPTLGALAFGFLFLSREDDISSISDLGEGTFSQRIMLAYAGVTILESHPIFGVGWQASASDAFLGSPRLQAELLQKFPNLPPHYFYSSGGTVTTVHNMYIQILAELGLLGAAVFGYSVVKTGRAIRRKMERIPRHSEYSRWATFYSLGLIYLLAWWNNNPLFGGQIESVLLFVFIALIASISRAASDGPAVEGGIPGSS